MNRKILFRGKRIDNGEWSFGDLLHSNTGKTYIVELVDDDSGRIIRVCHIEVDPTTVGEFTGLTDKNGTKIFEGDIVDYFSHSKAEIKYRNGSFMIWTKEMFDLLVNPQGDIEVIGNIHESEVGE